MSLMSTLEKIQKEVYPYAKPKSHFQEFNVFCRNELLTINNDDTISYGYKKYTSFSKLRNDFLDNINGIVFLASTTNSNRRIYISIDLKINVISIEIKSENNIIKEDFTILLNTFKSYKEQISFLCAFYIPKFKIDAPHYGITGKILSAVFSITGDRR